MTGAPVEPPLDETTIHACLSRGALEIDGRVLPASNATFVGEVHLDGVSLRCVYKPIRGERPLWDFPSGTLAQREVAAYEVSRGVGWDVVPATVLADGPFGRGMLQRWVDADLDAVDDLVDLMPTGTLPRGWRHVLDAWDGEERPISLVHADSAGLRRMAVFDVVVNNADRKAGHLLPVGGTLLGCDHGLTFHVEDKLRTVLWGWAGDRLTDEDLAPVCRLQEILDGGSSEPRLAEVLAGLLNRRELRALQARLRWLVGSRSFPRPPLGWRAVPWPIY